jgi:hypothetical protein
MWSRTKEAQVSELTGVRPTTRILAYLGTWEDIKELSKNCVLPPEMTIAVAVYALKRDYNAVQINSLINEWVQQKEVRQI